MEVFNKEPNVPVTESSGEQVAQTPPTPPVAPANAAEAPRATAIPAKSGTTSPWLEKFAKLDLKIKIALVAGIFPIILLLMFMLAPKKSKEVIFFPSPTPTPQPAASPVLPEVSAFAKTEQFMQFETNLKNYQTDVGSVDLTETALTFPFLNMNINFNK